MGHVWKQNVKNKKSRKSDKRMNKVERVENHITKRIFFKNTVEKENMKK